jgi:hypothetical protein
VTRVVFVAVVVVVALALLAGLRHARVGVRPALAIVFAYIAIPGHLARTRALDGWAATPPPALLLILGLTVLTVLIVLSVLGARLAGGIPLAAVVLLQSFRIPVEWVLHRLALEGAAPVAMTWAGRNFDIVSGVTALVLGGALLRGGRIPRWVVLAWNVLGLALLANVVAIAVLATPPFHRIPGPPNLLPGAFPWVWLPSFLVQVALGSHLLVFRQLRRAREG